MRRKIHQELPSRTPFLRSIRTIEERAEHGSYPFSIPAFSQGVNIDFESSVTFIVGENGTGKSTLLEAIAQNCGFNREGGSRDHVFRTQEENSDLAKALRLAWFPKVTEGFFLRAESFFNFATYIDQLAGGNQKAYRFYGGRSLHEQSHGEAFLSLFLNRFKNGIYILDEPEAALSPQRQLSFLRVMHDLEESGRAQFIIATHSPMILAYPGASLLSLDGPQISRVQYQDTPQFQLMRDFLRAPDRFFRHLFGD